MCHGHSATHIPARGLLRTGSSQDRSHRFSTDPDALIEQDPGPWCPIPEALSFRIVPSTLHQASVGDTRLRVAERNRPAISRELQWIVVKR